MVFHIIFSDKAMQVGDVRIALEFGQQNEQTVSVLPRLDTFFNG